MIEYPRYNIIPKEYIRQKIAEFLSEDIPSGDITSDPVFNPDDKIKAILQAESDQVFAGKQIIMEMFSEGFTTNVYFEDGQPVKNSEIIAEIYGSISKILAYERVLLNLIQRLSGIATLTRKYVEIASPFGVNILDTRKTTPGLRLFEKYAVAAGGGYNHRLDLSSGILIKDNHINAAGGVKAAVEKIKASNPGYPIELEVENEEQIHDGLVAGVDGFLIDNMLPEQTSRSCKLIRSAPNGIDIFIEASGGITLENIEGYLSTGINAISIGALTHSAKSTNIHLEFTK